MLKKELLLVITLLLTFSLKSFSEEKKTIKSMLESATVFFQGAELTHNTTAALTKGENEIWLEGLSPNVDRNSIKISASNGALITAFEFSIDYLGNKTLSPIEKKLQDSINYYQRQVKEIDVKLATTENMIGLLDANKSIAGTQTGLSVAELMKMMDYYQSKSNELQVAKFDYNNNKERFTGRISVIQKQLDQEKAKNTQTSGILKLNISAIANSNTNLKISYYTSSAGWTPYYDINVTDTQSPIKIASKAKVKQTTGINWDKVKLTLSTTTPSRGKTAPLFSTWFLNFQQNYPAYSSLEMASGRATQNSYVYADQAEKKIMIRGASSLKESAAPLIIVDGVPMEDIDINDIDASMIKTMDVIKDGSANALYGSRAANGVIVITTKNSMDDYVSKDDNQLSMTYNIALPYTIEGNGKEQSVDLQNLEVPAEFMYYATPKLDSETFLIANISDWTKLGLLSGKANVTFAGTYIGESNIDVNSTQEKLTLTLGTDKRIAVKREKLQDFSSKKFLGNSVKQEFVYQITVKNNQNQTVKLVLKDQYPLSTQKEIEVEQLKETTPPTFNNESVGVLSWEFELKPGESRVFKNAYSVKYPKDTNINL
ncbi:MAG: DUF4139 domain-containing protein [Dysgonomonas sp.]